MKHRQTTSTVCDDRPATLTVMLRRVVLAVLCLLALPAEPAWAVQTHGGVEGLVAHQIGHLLFTVGMICLLYRIYKNRETGPGRFEFSLFLILIVTWNVLTFSGHWLDELVDSSRFLREDGRITAFIIETPLDAVYYLTRLDHLLLVPAFVCLLLALKRWRVQP